MSSPDKPRKLCYSIRDAAFVLGGISLNHVRNLIASGKLAQVKIGRRSMVTAASMERLVSGGEQQLNDAAMPPMSMFGKVALVTRVNGKVKAGNAFCPAAVDDELRKLRKAKLRQG